MLRSVLLLMIVLLFQNPVHAQSFSYLALGDSYTIGEKVAEENRLPVILSDTLNDLGYPTSDPDVIATTGWTTSELQAGIKEAEITAKYSLVSLLIGVNNQYRGQDFAIFKEEFEQLLQQAIGFAGGQPDHVLVLSIPDYGVTPFAEEKNPQKIAQEIRRYNRIKQRISQKHGVHFVDITPISKQAETDSSLLAEDQLHPSDKMYRLWVEEALPVVLDEIKTWEPNSY